MSDEKDVIDVEVEEIGDDIFTKDSITPTEYFDYVKSKKKEYTSEEINIVIDNALKMLEKTKVTGQTEMAKKISHEVDLALREFKALEAGFGVYVSRQDVEIFINKIEGKAVKIIELNNFTRDVPDEAIDKIVEAKEIFDEIYVLFTDYTKKESKKVSRKRRDKDPVVFGGFIDNDTSEGRSYLEDKLFFICDWVDEQCDLTLEEIVRDMNDRENRIITHKVEIPGETDAIKELLSSYDTKKDASEDEPVSIFDNIKKKVRRGRSPKSENEKAKKKDSLLGRKKNN